jgi:hypothetical protein
MSNSFAEQLANVKLKPSKDKTKDFSDPKLAGEFLIYALLVKKRLKCFYYPLNLRLTIC